MSKRSEEQILFISECVHTEHTVECAKCDAIDGDDFGDFEDAAKEFYKSGWRVFDDEILCKKCFKNRNKK